ncbi:hypothetical protein A0H76_980 [Hepatospora eriocheir]|uniref:J domain-containing protein n=1 Tax=Hepatospora eriocheir TaxID=1081669 RepID=A0A1X0QHV9_9MICR|nr:hypothetical protein A0H76_980 [Hepatospora eriocheir]
MNFLFILLNLINCYRINEMINLKYKIKELHSKTDCKTFYELLGISELSSGEKIYKSYKSLLKTPSPYPSLTNKEYRDLVITAYKILKNDKVKYDMLLKDKIYYLDESIELTIPKLVWVIFSVILVILTDFIICLIRSINNKNNKKHLPEMVIKKIFRKLKIVK